MTITHITIPISFYQLDLPDKARAILGLAYSFSPKPLIMKNTELAESLKIRPDSIGKLITALEQKNYIRITKNQSPYREIYLGENPELNNIPVREKSLSKDIPVREKSLPTSGKIPNSYNEEVKEINIHPLFETFWKAYPKKEAKEAALKAFNKIKLSNELFGLMMAALEQQKIIKKWDKSNQFVPNASTWLNGKRWTDEIETPGDYAPATTECDPDEADEIFEKMKAKGF